MASIPGCVRSARAAQENGNKYGQLRHACNTAAQVSSQKLLPRWLVRKDVKTICKCRSGQTQQNETTNEGSVVNE